MWIRGRTRYQGDTAAPGETRTGTLSSRPGEANATRLWKVDVRIEWDRVTESSEVLKASLC